MINRLTVWILLFPLVQPGQVDRKEQYFNWKSATTVAPWHKSSYFKKFLYWKHCIGSYVHIYWNTGHIHLLKHSKHSIGPQNHFCMYKPSYFVPPTSQSRKSSFTIFHGQPLKYRRWRWYRLKGSFQGLDCDYPNYRPAAAADRSHLQLQTAQLRSPLKWKVAQCKSAQCKSSEQSCTQCKSSTHVWQMPSLCDTSNLFVLSMIAGADNDDDV